MMKTEMSVTPGFSFNGKGKLWVFEKPIVMGIINATTDSFFEGHLNMEPASILAKAAGMVADGATILDIGGQSTRPESSRITAAEEVSRVLPIIDLLHRNFPETIISVDTYFSKVAYEAVHAGASMVNDVTAGLHDEQMLSTVASLNVPYIIMHMKGGLTHMHEKPLYQDMIAEMMDYFSERLAACTDAGIVDTILDPGFGFSKSIPQNFYLLKQLAIFQHFGKPILAGLSRKSSIYKTLGLTAADALNGSTVMHTIALLNGASLLRVHDVSAAMEAIKLVDAYKKAAP